MYTPEDFNVHDEARIRELVERYGFATLVTAAAGTPTATHVPLLWDNDAEVPTLVGHVARANPQWRSFHADHEALAIFHGPHAYVSPSWYTTDVAVPTWNYVAVHAYGSPRVVDEPARTERVLAATIEQYEAPRPEPWSDRLPSDLRERLLKAIVVFEMPVTRFEAKAKLSQNRSDEDRDGVVAGLLREAGAAGEEMVRLWNVFE